MAYILTTVKSGRVPFKRRLYAYMTWLHIKKIDYIYISVKESKFQIPYICFVLFLDLFMVLKVHI